MEKVFARNTSSPRRSVAVLLPRFLLISRTLPFVEDQLQIQDAQNPRLESYDWIPENYLTLGFSLQNSLLLWASPHSMDSEHQSCLMLPSPDIIV